MLGPKVKLQEVLHLNVVEMVRYDSDKDTRPTVSSDLNTINSAPDKFRILSKWLSYERLS